MSEKEALMEKKLIDLLRKGESQWTFNQDITNEDELWENFRKKLNQNNIAVLNGQEITDNEFKQIKAFINEKAQSPYTAGVWLSGENGVAQIPLVRDDVKESRIILQVVNNREIAGGRSSYEVISQYRSPKKSELDENRRFDVTLLINGIPMIHIELKNRDHPFMDGFRQIQKYVAQGHFTGLFGMVQMFVVTNGEDTRYIAASESLNENFLTAWVDKNNNPVNDYLDFAKEVLNIPAAHYMVGKYSVMDNTRKKVIILRPYQIHAIEAIRNASMRRQSGFIWHTTGSGKTLTSYNVTKNLLDIPSIDKTLFLIDRRDLDTQTTDEFQSYAETDSIDVDETTNTKDLEKKLLDGRKQAIVTTIQKLQNVIKWYSKAKAETNPKIRKVYEKLNNLHIAFIVDECHRTVTPETKRILEQYFADSLWYGFTGTPIFAENKKAVKGDLPDTTEKLYGPMLHTYTIKEAIKNKAVLGFNVEMHDNMTEQELIDLGVELKAGSEKQLSYDDRETLERKVLGAYKAVCKKDFYDNVDHKKEVVRYILNKCAGKFGMNKGEGKTYDALLTVGSIKEAQEYYKLFKEMKGEVSDQIKRKLPDFPKFAITYTVGENQDGALANQTEMKASLADYNAMFGTNFSLDDGLRGYNTDLQKRLARKESKYKSRDEQLDLVIVVDRLLTGFDAPCLSTLFIDRPPMPPQNLIQAFSRTNRVFDNTKTYGQIVIFRTPAIYQKAVDEAIYLYSNGGSPSDVMAPTYEEMQKKLKRAIKELRKIAKKPEDIDLTDDTEILTKFAKAFQELDKILAAIFVYTDWNPADLTDVYKLPPAEIDRYNGKYQNVIDELKKRKGGSGDPDDPVEIPDIDIEYELEATSGAVINYRYIVALIQKYIPKKEALVYDVPNEEKRIKDSLKALAKSNKQLTGIIQSVWDKIRKHPEDYVGKNAMDLIREEIDFTIQSKIDALANKWCCSANDIKFHALHYREDDTFSDLTFDYKAYKAKGGTERKLMYEDSAVEDIKRVIHDEILPLLDF